MLLNILHYQMEWTSIFMLEKNIKRMLKNMDSYEE